MLFVIGNYLNKQLIPACVYRKPIPGHNGDEFDQGSGKY